MGLTVKGSLEAPKNFVADERSTVVHRQLLESQIGPECQRIVRPWNRYEVIPIGAWIEHFAQLAWNCEALFLVEVVFVFAEEEHVRCPYWNRKELYPLRPTMQHFSTKFMFLATPQTQDLGPRTFAIKFR